MTGLTEVQEQVLLGSFLGDGGLAKHPRAKYYRYQESHTIKQKEYIEWKFSILQTLPGARLYHKTSSRGNAQMAMYTGGLELFESWRKAFYPVKEKVVPEEFIRKLGPLGLAVWYMDDGTVTRNSALLCTDSFTQEDRELLRRILKDNFDLNTTIQKAKGRIAFGVKEKVKLYDIIRPFMVDSMKYKLRIERR